jgi:hypothetical protein
MGVVWEFSLSFLTYVLVGFNVKLIFIDLNPFYTTFFFVLSS